MSYIKDEVKHCKDCEHNDLELMEFNDHNQICLKGRCMYCKWLGDENCNDWGKK